MHRTQNTNDVSSSAKTQDLKIFIIVSSVYCN